MSISGARKTIAMQKRKKEGGGEREKLTVNENFTPPSPRFDRRGKREKGKEKEK